MTRGLSETTRDRLREVPAPEWAARAWRFVNETLEFAAPRETWGPGPWQDEPDRVEWRAPGSGYPLLAVRNHFGAWCGYVGLAPGRRYYGATMDDVADLHVHGGITYAAACNMLICHDPEPGEPDGLHWLGFDCCHAFDFLPTMDLERRMRERLSKDALSSALVARALHDSSYRDLGFVRAEAEALAAQLADGDATRG